MGGKSLVQHQERDDAGRYPNRAPRQRPPALMLGLEHYHNDYRRAKNDGQGIRGAGQEKAQQHDVHENSKEGVQRRGAEGSNGMNSAHPSEWHQRVQGDAACARLKVR